MSSDQSVSGSEVPSGKAQKKSNVKADEYNSEMESESQPAIPINQISEWEEPIEVHMLTLFDVHRKPRKVMTDPSSRVQVGLKVLSAEFHCPVCLGYMKRTMIVMECLHRFCGECIQKCLRLGKKECPSCRIHIPSRRSLRPDPNFDELIRNIYGDISRLESNEEKEIEELNKSKNMNNAYSESRKRGIMQQAVHRKKKNPKANGNNVAPYIPPKSPGIDRVSAEPFIPSITNLEDPPKVNFFLSRHPQETRVPNLKREFFCTANEMPVHTLKIFLSKKLPYDGHHSDIQIMTTSGSKGVVLEDDTTIGETRKDICNVPDGELVLHFRILKKE